GVTIVNQRAEEFGEREAFDIVVARALGALPVLLELTLPFCRVGGKVLAPKKGRGLADEVASASRALSVLGGELSEPRTYELDGEQRQIVVVRKVRRTPDAYPRRPGVPAKNHL